MFVESEHLSILVSNPRCTIVRVCNKHVDFYVVSAHAPYLQSTTDHKSWWEDFTNKIKQHCRFGKHVVIGIDVNCQICESHHFCGWGLPVKGGKPPANFLSMRKCISECGFVFPAGDPTLHANMPDYGTFCPTVGNSSIIIDQIGTIGRVQIMLKSIDTFPGLSRACNVDKDHIPIGARIAIATISSEGHNERRRIVQYDLSKIKEKECADAFRAKLRDFPVLGVEVENPSHCHLIQNYVHEALLDCFSMSKNKKKKIYH